MIQRLYTAANGMIAVEDRQAVIANNIANVSTNGFKRQLAIQTGYYCAYMDPSNPRALDLEVAPGGGLKTSETFTQHTNGGITYTGGPLHLALIGEGFFHIRGADSDLFTRSGQFTINANGTLVTSEGLPVLDVDGNEIDVSGGFARFDSNGNLLVDDENRATLAIVAFDDPHGLNRVGTNLYLASQEMMDQSAQAENTTLVVQSLEASNVVLPTEMVNLMMALRAYAANQKVISTIDETVSRMIDQVGGQ